ncbi:MAG: GtrA family protein [Alphaproteobacteria bacterium]
MIRIYNIVEAFWFRVNHKVRFILVGGFNTLFAFLLFSLFILCIHVDYRLSLLIQYVIATNVSIFTMGYYVFKNKSFSLNEYLRAWSVYIFMFVFNYLGLYFLVEICLLTPIKSQVIYTVISTILLYFLHKKFTFSRN